MTILKRCEINAPPAIRRGKTLQQCLRNALQALREYDGEEVGPDSDEHEHRLHRAMRELESFCSRTRGWRRLPRPYCVIWGELLVASREGLVDCHKAWRKRHGLGEAQPRDFMDFGPASPERAKEKASELIAAIADNTLKKAIECARRA